VYIKLFAATGQNLILMNRREKLRQEFDRYLNQILSQAQQSHIIKPLGRRINETTLAKFHIFNSQQNVDFIDAWLIKNDEADFALCCVDIDSTLNLRSYFSSLNETQTHSFLFAYLKTKNDFSRSYIRPETISDKMTELFQSAEIDFEEDPIFSSKYYCLSDDPKKFKSGMTPELRTILTSTPMMEIEFFDNECLFKSVKSVIDTNIGLQFIKTGGIIAKALKS
jgi:hypothetical protein